MTLQATWISNDAALWGVWYYIKPFVALKVLGKCMCDWICATYIWAYVYYMIRSCTCQSVRDKCTCQSCQTTDHMIAWLLVMWSWVRANVSCYSGCSRNKTFLNETFGWMKLIEPLWSVLHRGHYKNRYLYETHLWLTSHKVLKAVSAYLTTLFAWCISI